MFSRLEHLRRRSPEPIPLVDREETRRRLINEAENHGFIETVQNEYNRIVMARRLVVLRGEKRLFRVSVVEDRAGEFVQVAQARSIRGLVDPTMDAGTSVVYLDAEEEEYRGARRLNPFRGLGAAESANKLLYDVSQAQVDDLATGELFDRLRKKRIWEMQRKDAVYQIFRRNSSAS